MRAVERGAQDYLFKGQADGRLLARSLRYAIQRHRAEETPERAQSRAFDSAKISEDDFRLLDLESGSGKSWKKPWSLGLLRSWQYSFVGPERRNARSRSRPGLPASRRCPGSPGAGADEWSGQSKFGDRSSREPCIEETLQQCAGYRTLKKEGVANLLSSFRFEQWRGCGVHSSLRAGPRCLSPRKCIAPDHRQPAGRCGSESAASRGDPEQARRTGKGEQIQQSRISPR